MNEESSPSTDCHQYPGHIKIQLLFKRNASSFTFILHDCCNSVLNYIVYLASKIIKKCYNNVINVVILKKSCISHTGQTVNVNCT